MKINWTIVSIISRLLNVAISIIPGYVLISLLSERDNGLIRIVIAVTAMVGVFQNLGISSGSTREISAAKDLKAAGKVFVVALLSRYVMSIPVAFFLIFGSPAIAEYYKETRIVVPLIICGIVLLVQASQSTLKSLVQGLHKFPFLFSHQVFEALVNLFVQIAFLYFYGFYGYFVGLLVFNLVSTLTLAVYVIYLFIKGDFVFPTKHEIRSIFGSIFKIALVIFMMKILDNQWLNIGNALIGKVSGAELVAVFSTGLFLATKVMTISDAVTDVTLPKNTRIYESNRHEFGQKFNKSNSKAFLLILVSCVGIILLKRELLMLLDFLFQYIGKDPIALKYASSFRLVDFLVVAFWAYSQINLLKSGISVPAAKPMEGFLVYLMLYILTLIGFYSLNNFYTPDLSMAVSMMIGALLSYLIYIYIIKINYKFIPLLNLDVFLTILSAIAILFSHYLIGFNIVLFLIYVVSISPIAIKVLRTNEI